MGHADAINLSSNKNACVSISYWTLKIFGNGKLSQQIHSKSCWSYHTTRSTFQKDFVFHLQKPQKVTMDLIVSAVSSNSKNFKSKFTIKIKNKWKFIRIRSTPQNKVDYPSRTFQPRKFERNMFFKSCLTH